MRRTILLLGCAATLLVVAAACGDDDGSGATGGLDGRTFVSTEVTRALVDGTQIRLQFESGQVRANAGCNHLSAVASTEGDRLIVRNVGGTEMGCDPERHAQDEWIGAFLAGEPRWILDGDTLTLVGEEDTIVLSDREAAEPDRPLDGPTWVVDAIVDGDAVSSVPGTPEVEATMTFEDGMIGGKDGCNNFGGPVEVADGTITFGALRMTKMACPGDRDALARAVGLVLQGSVSYEIDADQLTLTAADGHGLVLRARD